MSAPDEKGPEPAELATFHADMAAMNAAHTLTDDPTALARLNAYDFLRLYKAVTDFRWNDPQHNLSADDERDPDDLRDLNEDNPERDYPLTLDGQP